MYIYNTPTFVCIFTIITIKMCTLHNKAIQKILNEQKKPKSSKTVANPDT